MAHQSNYEPKTAFTRWMDSRLPVIRMAYDTILDFPTPRNLNYMWTFGGILAFCLGITDHHRHRAGDALYRRYLRCVRFHRTSDAQRQLWLADALYARRRRVDVLPCRLSAHLPRPLLRLLQGAARNTLDHRRAHLPCDDGDGVHGLFAGLGADELLGGDRDHQPVLLARLDRLRSRHGHRAVDLGRLLGQ